MIVLRSALFAAWFFLGTFLVVFLGMPVLRRGEDKVVAYAGLWARIMLAGLHRICGITWSASGRDHLPHDGPALIASMHQSAFDTIIWARLAPRFTYVFKRELMSIPIFRRFMTESGMIEVDRAGGAKAMRALLRATDRAVASNRQIVIFPQGTRAAPGAPIELLPGVAAMAARSGLPVIPVVTDSGRLWGRGSFLKRPGVIRVAILPPLPAGLPRGELMDHLAAIYANAPAHLAAAVDNPVNTPS